MWTDSSRRKFLQTSGLGIGWLAALDLFQQTATAAGEPANPLAPKSPPLPATAKRVISLFMQGRPSHGSWILYGLGTENQNLPGFVVLLEGGVRSGPAVYGQGFLPAAYQGTSFRPGRNPILNLSPPAGMKNEDQRDLLDTLRKLNEQHLGSRNHDSELSARIASYELAFRMQMSAPEATDVSSESDATKKLYGLDNPVSADFGGRCLLARRLVEGGVRFVQGWSGDGQNADDWDGHIECDKNHQARAAQTDKAVAGLLTDLKSRGLLDSTLVS